MTWSDRPRHSDAACARLLDRFLLPPEELAGIWWHGRLEDRRESPDQVIEVLGLTLWDVFSDNHTMIDGDGTAYDLGSFRGTAGFIAESINSRYDDLGRSYDYLDFYLGPMGQRDRARLEPVYRWIFGVLKREGCRWIYSFPRLHLVDFGCPPDTTDPTTYDPSAAVRAELEQARHAEDLTELVERLERAFDEDIRRARKGPLPATVAAYREVYGAFPEGWPHPDM